MSDSGIFDVATQAGYEGTANITPTERVAALYEAYRTKIYRFLVGQGLDPSNAQELTQEAFVRLFVALTKGNEIEAERAWLFAVASKLAVDYWRREGRPMWVELDSVLAATENVPSSDPTPEAIAVEQQKLKRVALAIAGLPKEQRLSIQLRMKGMRYREIAKVLGVSISTVSALLSAALERLRRTANE
jgi:RNA polymerase sigma-70 factor (ECF subfamily)